MRIALVTESFYPAVDSATTTVRHVADHLIDAGHDVRIVAPGPGLATYRRSRIVRVKALDHPGRQVRAELEAFTPDLVQVHSPGVVGRKALKHARRLDLRTLTVQQSVVGEVALDYWLRKVAERSDEILATSPWQQRRLSEAGVSASLWEPGVDPAAFTPALRDDWLHGKWSRRRSPEGARVVVGYAGSLHKRNGVRRLPEIAELPGVRLVVIGDGPQKTWLKLHLPGTKFLGALPTGEMATALASLDLLVHPGTEETDCHTLREAAASRVPVIAPAVGGSADVVRHHETGLLYDPAEDLGMVRAVDTLARDELRRTIFGVQARAVAGRRTWRDACVDLAGHHDRLIGHEPQLARLP